MLLPLVGVVLLLAFLLHCIRFYRDVARFPPGPRPLPFIGNLLALNVQHPHKAIESFSSKYGHVFTLFLPLPVVVITGLEEMKEALIVKGDNFSGRPSTPTDSFFMNIPNGGIIFAQGDEWREQRAFALAVLRSFGVGSPVMEEVIHNSLDDLFEYLANCDISDMDINWPVHLCVGNVVHQLLFGHFIKHNNSTQMRYYQDLIEDAMVKVRSSPFVPLVQAYPWTMHLPVIGWRGYGEMRSVALELIAYVDGEIERHKKALESADADDEPRTLVDAYLREMRRREQSGEMASFSRDNLVNVATDLWLAGMETAATSVRWGLLLLVAHPQVQERLFAEIERVIGRRRVAMADRLQMPYAAAVIYEIQRVANVVTFNVLRKTFRDDDIFGKRIPAGTTILPQICTVMADDAVFEDAEKFSPDRFLDHSHSPPTLIREHTEKVVAFSMGRRQCAGESLARVELFLVLLSMVQRFRLSAASSQPTPPSLEPVFGILQTPEPFRYKLEERF